MADGSGGSNVTGGTLTLNANGIGTGNFTFANNITATVESAKMDMDKEFALLGQTDSTGGYKIAFAIKGGGVFAVADYEGTWYFLGINSANMAFYGQVAVNNLGVVTGGNLYYTNGVILSITGGNISISGAGKITGTITDSTGDTLTFLDGKMTPGKTAFCGQLRSGATGVNVLLQGAKAGGAFATADLAGTWYLFEGEDSGYAGYGNMTLDNAGNITGGSITSLESGIVDTVTSGTFAINIDGEISGNLANAVQIIAGKMSTNTALIGGVLVPIDPGGPAPTPAPTGSGGGGGGGCFISSLASF